MKKLLYFLCLIVLGSTVFTVNGYDESSQIRLTYDQINRCFESCQQAFKFDSSLRECGMPVDFSGRVIIVVQREELSNFRQQKELSENRGEKQAGGNFKLILTVVGSLTVLAIAAAVANSR